MNSQPASEDTILLMNTDRIQRSLSRMAYQIAEDNREDAEILIIGIKQRGRAVAKAISSQLADLAEKDVTLLSLQEKDGRKLAFSASGDTLKKTYSYIILVDDVIFTGQTMLDAVKKTLDIFSPRVLRTAVLVDRGHRKMPVGATFSGINLPTKLNEHVQVQIKDEKPFEVILTKTGE